MSADRSQFIGGSDAAAVLGISPWKTPLNLYIEKTTPRVEETDPARLKVLNRGSRLEPYIRDMLVREHRFEECARNERYVDAEHPFLAAEIDVEGFLESAGTDRLNVEIKTVHPFKVKDWGDEDTDSIPVHYAAQAMHGLMVSGRGRCVFAVLIGDDLRLYRVDRDPETIAGMREREVAFWNDHVLAGVPPAPTSAADVMKLFARDNGLAVEATPDIFSVVCDLRALKDRAKTIAKQIEEASETVKLYMGPASVLTYESDSLLTWKTQTAQRFDQTAFAAAHPSLHAQFKAAASSRVLRIR